VEVFISNVVVTQFLAAFKEPEEVYLVSKGQQLYFMAVAEEEAYLVYQASLMPLHSRDLI
jgi:hypothetical protein